MAALTIGASISQAQHSEPLSLTAPDGQYAFLTPLLKDVEVVSLPESIHITDEFPVARLGVVRWIHENSGYSVLAFEGSPEDMWISQDSFLRDPRNLAGSTSGLFAIWNSEEMHSIFDYERSTWSNDRPLYITAYDIQPGTGRGSSGARVFSLLQEHLAHYAPPPSGLDVQAWGAALTPLTSACRSYTSSDDPGVERAIGLLERWIAIVAPKVEAAYPRLPMHAETLRLIPQNLRESLGLCQAVGGADGVRRNWAAYKQTRDRLAARYALSLKAASPDARLILWAHFSHLSYDAEGNSTSVGEILHEALGPRLYTIGTFAVGGGTIVLFSDVDDDVGYMRVFGISQPLKRFLSQHCSGVCFTDLRSLAPESPMAGPQRLWIEAGPRTVLLAKDVDGAIWVMNVHPAHLRLGQLLVLSGKHYVKPAIALVVLLAAVLIGLAFRRRRRSAATLRV